MEQNTSMKDSASRPNFWRAPTDNDYGNGQPKREQIWKQSSKNFHVTDATATIKDGKAIVNVNYLLPAGNLYIITYTVYPSGVVNVAAHFTSTDMDALLRQKSLKQPEWQPLLRDRMLPALLLPN